MIQRRKWLVACVAALVLLGACGGGGDDGDDGAAKAAGDTQQSANDEGGSSDASTDDTPAAADDAATDFTCPVTLADVEAAYAPVQFKDAEIGEADCTFQREDEIGSAVVEVRSGDARASYAARLATMPDKEAVDGIGDEAAYSPGFTTLAARDGDKVVTVMAVSMLGVGGDDATTGEEIAKRIKDATVKLGTKAAANV